ncbi:MAG: Lrp/AsnC ligand binding domain-containing protein [Anaerolineales bacterium]|nr:Lrp/AsnC ligand binding domain-containing protein [Anaerolineales bacterium]
MKAYVLINVKMGRVREVVKNLKRSEKVVEASMTFGPYDAVALVQFDNLDELGNLLANVIQPIPGVLETLTCLAADH